jgi:hypothetical protein
MAKFKLSNIKTEEVSLVPKGANNKKFFLIKSADGDMVLSTEELVSRLIDSDDEAVKKICEGAPAEIAEAVKVVKTLLQVIKDNVSDPSTNQIFQNLLKELHGESQMSEEEKKVETPEAAPEAQKPVEEQKGDDKPAAPEEVAKAVKVEKENVELKKELANFKKKFEESENARITKEFIEEARGFKNLSMTPEEFGPVLKSIKDATAEGYEKLMTVLKSADEMVGQSVLLASVGSDNKIASNGAWEKIEKLAEGMVQKSSTPMKQADAISLVLKTEEGKKLYNQYNIELGGVA